MCAEVLNMQQNIGSAADVTGGTACTVFGRL